MVNALSYEHISHGKHVGLWFSPGCEEPITPALTTGRKPDERHVLGFLGPTRDWRSQDSQLTGNLRQVRT